MTIFTTGLVQPVLWAAEEDGSGPVSSIEFLTMRCQTEKDTNSCYRLGTTFFNLNDRVAAKKWYYAGCQLEDPFSCRALKEIYDTEKRELDERYHGKKQNGEESETGSSAPLQIEIKDLNEATVKKMDELKKQCVKDKYPAACYQLGTLQSRYSREMARPSFKFGCKLGHKKSCEETEK